MRKTLIAIASLACLLWLPSLGRAQALSRPPEAWAGSRSAPPSATPSRDFWARAVQQRSTVCVPVHRRRHRISATTTSSPLRREGDFHCLCLHTSLDRAELTYLVGPRITLPMRNRFIVYGKAIAGIRDLFIQEQQDNTSSTRPSRPRPQRKQHRLLHRRADSTSLQREDRHPRLRLREPELARIRRQRNLPLRLHLRRGLSLRH